MRRILTSLFMIGVVTALVTGATSAYFTDTAEIKGVTFSTGNADLRIANSERTTPPGWADNPSGVSIFEFNEEKWYPGKEVHESLYLGNFSQSPVALAVSAKITSYSETIGGLGNVFLMKLGSSDWHTLNWWRNHTVELLNVPYAADHSSSNLNNFARLLKVWIKMDPNAGNAYTGGSISFNLHFDAEQVH